MAVGTYTATVTVSATNLTPVTFTVTQEVQANSVTAPDVPTNVLATPGDSYVRVSFDVPTNNGGSTITGYTVKVYVGGVEQPMLAKIGTLSPIIVTGLTNGTAYTFKVLATNIAGNSGESMASNVVTPVAPTAPGQPTIPVPTPSSPSSPTTSTKIQVGLEIDGDNPLEKNYD
ncbi:fibronectin type III domain-containing protein [Lysinibacillus sp. MHQ-1]|nr:fibronectin type III domain-containing protein [Lysinibacillus sp. MHQ-1]